VSMQICRLLFSCCSAGVVAGRVRRG